MLTLSLRFQDARLETQWRHMRDSALRANDLLIHKYAYLMNIMFNLLMLSTGRAPGAAMLYSATLLFQSVSLHRIPPALYEKHRDVLVGACRMMWHASCWWGLVRWCDPYSDTLPCFIKVVLVLSGIVALNWLLVFTLASSLAVNTALQLGAAAVYVCRFTPRHVCPLLLRQRTHVAYLRRTWGAANSVVNAFSQVMMLPVVPASFDETSQQQACLQVVAFMQLLLGVALPLIGTVVLDVNARRQYLLKLLLQQQVQVQQQLAQQGDADGGASQGGSSSRRSGSGSRVTGVVGADAALQQQVPQQLLQWRDDPQDFVVSYSAITACLLVLTVGLWQLAADASQHLAGGGTAVATAAP